MAKPDFGPGFTPFRPPPLSPGSGGPTRGDPHGGEKSKAQKARCIANGGVWSGSGPRGRCSVPSGPNSAPVPSQPVPPQPPGGDDQGVEPQEPNEPPAPDFPGLPIPQPPDFDSDPNLPGFEDASLSALPKPSPPRIPLPRRRRRAPAKPRPSRRAVPRRTAPPARIPIETPFLRFRGLGVLGAALAAVPFVVKALIKADDAGTRAWAEKLYGADNRRRKDAAELRSIVPGVSRLPVPGGEPVPTVHVVGRRLSDRVLPPRFAVDPLGNPFPGLQPFGPAHVPFPSSRPATRPGRAPQGVKPRANPKPKFEPIFLPPNSPVGLPGRPGHFLSPLADVVRLPRPRIPGLPAPRMPPGGANPIPLPGLPPGTIALPSPQPVPQANPNRCNCPPKKPRKPREPRKECTRGTYLETARGLEKTPKEKVPCQ